MDIHDVMRQLLFAKEITGDVRQAMWQALSQHVQECEPRNPERLRAGQLCLIAMHEWHGTVAGVDRPWSEERYLSFATRLDLAAALGRILQYQRAFKMKHQFSSVEFRLLSVSTMPEIDEQLLDALQVQMVEDLEVEDPDIVVAESGHEGQSGGQDGR